MTLDRQAALEHSRMGDVQALGDLLESFRPYVRTIVQGFRDARLQARVGESDMIQDIMLEAHRAFPGFRGNTVAELVVWLRQICVRSASDTVRALAETAKRDPDREQRMADLGDVVADASTPSAQAMRHEEAASMAAALAQLPDDMRAVILGRHVENLSHAEIAERLGRSEGAVRVLYVRALDRLRERCSR